MLSFGGYELVEPLTHYGAVTLYRAKEQESQKAFLLQRVDSFQKVCPKRQKDSLKPEPKAHLSKPSVILTKQTV